MVIKSTVPVGYTAKLKAELRQPHLLARISA
jgi:UDP-glucose 6-dehydrogenase